MTGPWDDPAGQPAPDTESKQRGAPDAPEAAAAIRHRLHPLTLLVRFISMLPQYVIALPAAYFALSNKGGGGYFLLLVLFGIAIAMGIAWISWRRFFYEVGEEEIRIQKGVLSRQNRSIPYERIQDVNVEQKLVARLFGLAAVKLETGSGGGDDGVLNAVDLEEAERLRDIIRRRKGAIADTPQARSKTAGSPATADEGEPIFTMDNRRILIAGIFNFSLVFLAILGAIFQNLDFLVPDTLLDPEYWIRESRVGEQFQAYGTMARFGGALLALGGLVATGLAYGIISTFVREYGFRLDRGEGGFRRRRGLFTLTDVAMPLHRVQAAVIRTGPIRRRYGWYHLKFQSLARDGKNESDHSVAPLATQAEIAPIIAETSIHQNITPEDLRGVHSAHWWMPLLFILPLATIGVFIGSVAADARLLWLLLPLYVIPTVVGVLHWRHHRYALKEGQLFVTNGFWRQRTTIVPLAKVQTVDVADSVLSRALGLAHVTIGVAGGSGTFPLTVRTIGRGDAMELRDLLLRVAEA